MNSPNGLYRLIEAAESERDRYVAGLVEENACLRQRVRHLLARVREQNRAIIAIGKSREAYKRLAEEREQARQVGPLRSGEVAVVEILVEATKAVIAVNGSLVEDDENGNVHAGENQQRVV